MGHIIVSDDIMEKVSNEEKNAERLNRCLAAKICPKCGERLGSVIFNDGGYEYNCIDCDFSLIR